MRGVMWPYISSALKWGATFSVSWKFQTHRWVVAGAYVLALLQSQRKLNVALGPKRCIKSSMLLIGISLFSYHYFRGMKYAFVIKKKKLHGKSSLYEGLKVKSVFVLISFSSISIHWANEADFHSVQSHCSLTFLH